MNCGVEFFITLQASEHTLGIVKLISFITLQAYVLSKHLRIVQLNSFITMQAYILSTCLRIVELNSFITSQAYFEHTFTNCAVEFVHDPASLCS